MSLVGSSKTHRDNNGFSGLVCSFSSELSDTITSSLSSGISFTYGDGSHDHQGCTMPVSGKVIALTVSSASSGVGVLELHKSDVATGIKVDLVGNYGIEYCNYSFNAGDRLHIEMKTYTSGTVTSPIAIFFVKFD